MLRINADAVEYDPQPPFGAGSPEKAPAAAVELVRAVVAQGDPSSASR